MKKIFFNSVVVVVMFFALIWAVSAIFPTPSVYAVTNGTSVANESFTLYNSATTTTGQTSGTAKTLDYVFTNLICDVTVTPSTAGTTTFAVYYNAGTSSTSFDTIVSLIAPTVITSGQTIRTFKSSGVPFRTIRPVFTAPTSTAVVKINCGAVQ